MSKFSFFLLPTLLASTSAFALSCYDGSTGCIDAAQASKDCLNLGYSLNEPECEHYLLCPFNTDYKICVKEKTGDTPTPTPNPDPSPSYNCNDMARKLKNAASYRYYFTCENKDNTCITNDSACSKHHHGDGDGTWNDPCLSTIAGASTNQASTKENCEAMKIRLRLAIEKHNENCPPLDIQINVDCNQCMVNGQGSVCESYSEFLNPCRFDKFNVVSENKKKNDPCYIYKPCMDGKQTKYEEREAEQVCINAAGNITYQPSAGYTCFYCKKQ